ncbi:MAG: ABC transporter permease, partial [Bacteroidaceae bacterium]|nr:ABC transporter permease [Bacteroidaceae bacterium]
MRNLLRNLRMTLRGQRLSSVLNVAGLAIAIAVAYTMFVQVNYDFSYNRGIKDAGRLFRVEHKFIQDFDWTYILTTPLARIMVTDNPAVEGYHFGHLQNRDVDHTFEKFPDEPIVLAGTELSDGSITALGIELVEGDFEPVLKRSAMAFSRSVAQKYGLEIGDRVCWGGTYNAEVSLTVGAIFEDLPQNSDIAGLEAFYGPYYDKMESNGWSNWNDPLYVRLRSEDDTEAFLQHASAQIMLLEYNERFKEKTIDEVKKNIRLTPFTETYFTTDMEHFDLKVGNRTTTFTMLTLAVVTLLIAFINFFNFFVALIPKRIRNINTQKILGAHGISLRVGVFFEAAGLLAIAMLVSLLLVNMVEKSAFRELLSVSLFAPENMWVAIGVALATLLMALLTAAYPAWYLTSFAPAFVLKGSFGATSKGQALRNILIGMQFVLSFLFIIVAIFIAVQNSFMKNHDMGFDRDCILEYKVYNVYPESFIDKEQRETLRNALLTSPFVEAVTFCSYDIVGDGKEGWGREWSRSEGGINFRVLPVEPGFMETMGIAVPDGVGSDGDAGVFVFNTAARKKYGMEIGDKINHNGVWYDVVGFCSDINERSMQHAVEPFAFFVNPQEKMPVCYIRIKKGSDLAVVQQQIRDITEKLGRNESVEYAIPVFLDEKSQKGFYEKEDNQQS